MPGIACLKWHASLSEREHPCSETYSDKMPWLSQAVRGIFLVTSVFLCWFGRWLPVPGNLLGRGSGGGGQRPVSRSWGEEGRSFSVGYCCVPVWPCMRSEMPVDCMFWKQKLLYHYSSINVMLNPVKLVPVEFCFLIEALTHHPWSCIMAQSIFGALQ